MKVLITGATGLVGKEIVKLCHSEGISVNYLTTSKLKIRSEHNYKGFFWNPSERKIDPNCLDGVNVIINLAGAPVSNRWTNQYKQEILDSRLESLQLLKETISVTNHHVSQFISASAIGIYPNSSTNFYDEEFPDTSSNFLGKVVNQWEQKMDEFSDLNISVSKIRIGLVLSKQGGVLAEILKPIKLGLGAAFGTGKQWQSWIHISDVAGLFMHVMNHNLTGIYNGVAPNPLTNLEFTKAVAKVLHKPLLLPSIPKYFMKLVLGEMHILLFESQRVSSKKIENSGFHFKFHNLQGALDDLM